MGSHHLSYAVIHLCTSCDPSLLQYKFSVFRLVTQQRKNHLARLTFAAAAAITIAACYVIAAKFGLLCDYFNACSLALMFFIYCNLF